MVDGCATRDQACCGIIASGELFINFHGCASPPPACLCYPVTCTHPVPALTLHSTSSATSVCFHNPSFCKIFYSNSCIFAFNLINLPPILNSDTVQLQYCNPSLQCYSMSFYCTSSTIGTWDAVQPCDMLCWGSRSNRAAVATSWCVQEAFPAYEDMTGSPLSSLQCPYPSAPISDHTFDRTLALLTGLDTATSVPDCLFYVH